MKYLKLTIPPLIMIKVLRKVSVVLGLAIIGSSCVSQKQYIELAKDRKRLDMNVERAHKEIRELKEVKLNLEDQIKAKNVEIIMLEQKVSDSFKRQTDEMGAKFTLLDEQLRKMTADLEANKSENASLIANYVQLITELQIANAAMAARKVSKKLKTKPRSKVSLPAKLKLRLNP